VAVNYDLVENNKMKIKSVESQQFQGELFVCEDPITHDLLHVKQYDSIAEIQDWIEAHPGVFEACDLIVRYSDFNEGAVSVTSKANGVQVTVGQGVGIGRVIDALIFDPSL
jgi:hypothetical protein